MVLEYKKLAHSKLVQVRAGKYSTCSDSVTSPSLLTHPYVVGTVSGPRSGRHPLESAKNLGARICGKMCIYR